MPVTPPDEFVIETPVEDEIWRREQERYLTSESCALLNPVDMQAAAAWARAAVESYRACLPERVTASLESLAAENSAPVSPAPTPAEDVSLGETAPSHPLADFVRHGCVACPIPAQELRPGDILFHAEARHSVVSVHPYTHGGIATNWELKQGVSVRVGDYSLDFARDAQVVVLRKVANDDDSQPIPDDQKLHALGLLRTLATAFGSGEDGVHAEALADLKRLIRDGVSNAPIEESTEDAPLESVAAQDLRPGDFVSEAGTVTLHGDAAKIASLEGLASRLNRELDNARELTRNAKQILCDAFDLDLRSGHIVDKALTAALRYERLRAEPQWLGREDMLKQSTELRQTLTAALGPLPTDHPHLLAAIRDKLEGTVGARDPELDEDWPLPDGYSWVDPTMIECTSGRAWVYETGSRCSIAADLNPSAVAVLFDRWRARQGQPIADPPERSTVASDHANPLLEAAKQTFGAIVYERSDPDTLTALGLDPHPDRVISTLAEESGPTPWFIDDAGATRNADDGFVDDEYTPAFVAVVNAACARVRAADVAHAAIEAETLAPAAHTPRAAVSPDRVIAWLAEPAVNPTPWKLILDRVSNTQRIEDAEGAQVYGRPPVTVPPAFVEAVNAACARVEAGEESCWSCGFVCRNPECREEIAPHVDFRRMWRELGGSGQAYYHDKAADAVLEATESAEPAPTDEAEVPSPAIALPSDWTATGPRSCTHEHGLKCKYTDDSLSINFERSLSGVGIRPDVFRWLLRPLGDDPTPRRNDETRSPITRDEATAAHVVAVLRRTFASARWLDGGEVCLTIDDATALVERVNDDAHARAELKRLRDQRMRDTETFALADQELDDLRAESTVLAAVVVALEDSDRPEESPVDAVRRLRADLERFNAGRVALAHVFGQPATTTLGTLVTRAASLHDGYRGTLDDYNQAHAELVGLRAQRIEDTATIVRLEREQTAALFAAKTAQASERRIIHILEEVKTERDQDTERPDIEWDGDDAGKRWWVADGEGFVEVEDEAAARLGAADAVTDAAAYAVGDNEWPEHVERIAWGFAVTVGQTEQVQDGDGCSNWFVSERALMARRAHVEVTAQRDALIESVESELRTLHSGTVVVNAQRLRAAVDAAKGPLRPDPAGPQHTNCRSSVRAEGFDPDETREDMRSRIEAVVIKELLTEAQESLALVHDALTAAGAPPGIDPLKFGEAIGKLAAQSKAGGGGGVPVASAPASGGLDLAQWRFSLWRCSEES